jgi:hypothetical protein
MTEAGRDGSYALYNKFDIKNLNVKTDGSPVTYKPEYHSSNVSSNVFAAMG